MKDRLEEWANWLSDMDREWWPFLFMRPDPHVKMSSVRVFALAVLYGVFAGMLFNVLVAASGRALNPVWLPLGGTVGFFVFYRFTFAMAWNRRAERKRQAIRWASRAEDAENEEPEV